MHSSFTFRTLAVCALSLASCTSYDASGLSAPARSYTLGQAVPYTSKDFSIDVFVVNEDTPGVGDTINAVNERVKRAGKTPTYANYSQPLYQAAKAGSLPRFAGEDMPTVLLGNVPNTALLPDSVPYKSGWGMFAGMAKVVRLGPHDASVTFPLRGGAGLGQGGPVFPRQPLMTRDLTVCVRFGIDVLYVPEITRGSHAGEKRTLCDFAHHAGERVLSGKDGMLFSAIAAPRATTIVGR